MDWLALSRDGGQDLPFERRNFAMGKVLVRGWLGDNPEFVLQKDLRSKRLAWMCAEAEQVRLLCAAYAKPLCSIELGSHAVSLHAPSTECTWVVQVCAANIFGVVDESVEPEGPAEHFVLHVFLREGDHILGTDVTTQPSPSIRLYAGNSSAQSATRHRSDRPIWDERFALTLWDRKSDHLIVECWDDHKHPTNVSEARVPLQELNVGRTEIMRVMLCDSNLQPYGEVRLELTLHANVLAESIDVSDPPPRLMLQVYMDRAVELESAKVPVNDKHGLNPYVSLLFGTRRHVQRHESIVCQKTFDPIWEQTACFDVFDLEADLGNGMRVECLSRTDGHRIHSNQQHELSSRSHHKDALLGAKSIDLSVLLIGEGWVPFTVQFPDSNIKLQLALHLSYHLNNPDAPDNLDVEAGASKSLLRSLPESKIGSHEAGPMRTISTSAPPVVVPAPAFLHIRIRQIHGIRGEASGKFGSIPVLRSAASKFGATLGRSRGKFMLKAKVRDSEKTSAMRDPSNSTILWDEHLGTIEIANTSTDALLLEGWVCSAKHPKYCCGLARLPLADLPLGELAHIQANLEGEHKFRIDLDLLITPRLPAFEDIKIPPQLLLTIRVLEGIALRPVFKIKSPTVNTFLRVRVRLQEQDTGTVLSVCPRWDEVLRFMLADFEEALETVLEFECWHREGRTLQLVGSSTARLCDFAPSRFGQSSRSELYLQVPATCAARHACRTHCSM